jgi:(2R)-3-sulfolactate dehydrogenase (NADP+)
VVIDLSLGSITRGRIAELAQRGQPLPAGSAYDRSGVPTTDAAAALAGMVAPIGGPKGAALALILESLTGGLVGPRLAVDVADPLAPDQAARHQGLSHLVMAFDPSALSIDCSSRSRLDSLAQSVLASGGRLPGSNHPPPDSFTGAEIVQIAEPTERNLASWARRLGVETPESWRPA